MADDRESRPTQKTLEAAEFLAARFDHRPQVAIILGSGLGNLIEHLVDPIAIDYQDIPHWQRTHAAGHQGKLVFGSLQSTPVVAMAGRFHRYEGWSNDTVCFPVRVLSAIGAQRLIVSNAAGAVNPRFDVGDIVVIHDHIDWIRGHVSMHHDNDSSRSTPASDAPHRQPTPYDRQLCTLALRTARQEGFAAHPGTYLATLGPTYETRAEYRMMRRLGADVVGMSTVPEVLQAQRIGMRILALSMVSNVARPDAPELTSHDEVLDAARIAGPRMHAIVRQAVSAQLCSEAD